MNSRTTILLLFIGFSQYCFSQYSRSDIYVLFKSGITEKVKFDKTNFGNIEKLKTTSIDISDFVKSYAKLSKINIGKFPDLYKINCFDSITCLKLIEYLKQSDITEFIEYIPQYIFFFTPNDFNSSKQYALSRIQATQAWDLANGNRKAIIAIVDDAVDTLHSDLKMQLWRNIKEIKSNGLDDDGNGYIDDWFGWDAADGDNNPNPPSYANATNFNHGTHCAGIATASTNNNIGIASIGFNLRLMPVKIGRDIDNSIQNAFEGVEYAILNGANTISMSWGGSSYSNAMQMLFDYANSKDIVCIAAAGNDGKQNVKYPAAYRNVISVGSTDQNDKVSGFSNYGNWLDVFAPGSDIYSTVPGNSYINLSGTSMACPLVAGLCALMKAYKPDANASEIEQCLKSSCDDISSQNLGKSGLLGAGRINAYESLLCLKNLRANFKSDFRSVCKGNSVQYFDISNGNPTFRSWKFEGGNPTISSDDNPVVSYLVEGIYRTELIVSDGTKSDTFYEDKYIKVYTPSVRFSGNKTVSKSSTSYFTAHFKGQPPFKLIYTDGQIMDTIENIVDSLYDIVKIVIDNKKYWPISLIDNNCIGHVSDTAKLNVFNDSGCIKNGKLSVYIGSSRNDAISGAYLFKNDIYIIGGHSDSAGNFDAIIQLVHKNGKIISGRRYGFNGDQKINKFLKVESGYLFIGSSNIGGSGNEDVLLIKINNNLDIVWTKLIGGSNSDIGLKGYESINKNYYLISASTISFGQGNTDAYIIKIDSNGVVRWTRVLGNANYGIANELIELPSKYIIVSSGTYYQASNKPFYIKLDPNGNVVWVKEDANSQQSDAQALKLNGNNLIGTIRYKGSNSEKDGMVFKSDTNLNVIWSKCFTSITQDVPNNLEILEDETILINGFTYNSNSFGSIDNWYVRFSQNGNMLNNKFYGGNGDEVPTFCFSNVNEVLICGYSNSSSFGSNDGYFKRLNCNLEICDPSVSKFSLSNINLNFVDITLPNTIGGNSNSITLNSTPFKLRSKYLCADTVPEQNIPCRLKADFGFEALCAGTASLFFDKSIDSNSRTIRSRKWIFDNEVIEGPAEIKYTFTSPGMHTVSLYVHSGDTVLCSEIASKQVWISDSLKIEVYNDTVVCVNDSATLGIKSLFCGTAPFTYKWAPATGLDKTNAATVKAAPASPTVYTLIVTDANGKTANASMQVGIDGSCCRSYAGISISDHELCPGQPGLIFDNSRSGAGTSYKWRFMPDASPAGSTQKDPPPVSFSGPGLKTIELVITDACGIDTAIEYLAMNELPPAFAGRDTVICFNNPVQLGEQGLAGRKYIWKPALYLNSDRRPDPTSIPQAAISYVLEVTDLYTSCANTDTVNIKKMPTPPLQGLGDTVKCDGMPVSISIPVQNGIQYSWYDATASNPKLFMQAGTYWLKAATNCTDTTVYFTISDTACNCIVFLPNAFTPNDDVLNDGFGPVSSCELIDYQIMVFNRWGEIIWKSENPLDKWDGTYKGEIVCNGVYFYTISYRRIVLNSSKFELKKGFVEVLK